jgi:hypothetical protein
MMQTVGVSVSYPIPRGAYGTAAVASPSSCLTPSPLNLHPLFLSPLSQLDVFVPHPVLNVGHQAQVSDPQQTYEDCTIISVLQI